MVNNDQGKRSARARRQRQISPGVMLAVSATTLGLAAGVNAAQITYNVVSDGSYNVPTTYNPNGTPNAPSPATGTPASTTPGDIVQFNGTTNFTVTVDGTDSTGNNPGTVQSGAEQINIANGFGTAGTLLIKDGGSLTIAPSFTASGTALTNGGLSGDLLLGRNTSGANPGNATGTLNMTGGVLTLVTVTGATGVASVFNNAAGGNLSIADRGSTTGIVNVSGGTLNVGNDMILSAGNQSAASGSTATNTVSVVTQTGGTINVAGKIVMGGLSTYNMSGGALNQLGTTGGRAASASYNFSGTNASGVNSRDLLLVGVDPTSGATATASIATFNQSGGVVTLTGGVEVGGNTLGNGTYNFSGGILDASNSTFGMGVGSSVTAFGDNGVKTGVGAFIISSQAGGADRIVSNTLNAGGSSGATLGFRIGSDAGTTPITLTGSGSNTLVVGSATQVDLDPINGYVPSNTNVAFVLLTMTNAASVPASLLGSIPVTPDGDAFDGYVVQAVANPNGTGFIVEAVVPTPEPTSLGLLGLAGLLGLRRRRRGPR